MESAEKLKAIYSLRSAAEDKVRAELVVERHPTPAARDALLDATLRLEDRTQHAIEVCHYCGRPHAPDEPHGGGGNVIDVDFS